MKTNDIFNIDKLMTESTQTVNEVDPRNFDSDEDYYAAVRGSSSGDDDYDDDMGDDDYDDDMGDDESHYEKYVRTKNLENAEYDDEAGMVDNNLETLERAIEGIDEIVHPGSNLPEWCQEKIAQAKGMLDSVYDYMQSEQENGMMDEDWQKVNKRDKTDGLSRKAVKAYRREHPGSKLQTAVTTKPSKLKKGSKSAKRRKSFCARMSGMKKAHASAKTKRDPNSPINKALRRWNCESVEQLQQVLESQINEIKQRLDPKCWKGKHKEGTKIKGGVRVNNCVPNEGVAEGAVPDYEAMFLNEFASAGGGAGGIATSMAVGNPAAGSLFGGSYSQKNSPFKKNKPKKSGMIKR